MKIIVVSPTPTSFGMVKNIFTAAKVKDAEVVATVGVEDTLAALTPQSVVLIDWEFHDEKIPVRIVIATRAKNLAAAILLLCVKQKAGGTFAAMKAGAHGVVHKPLDGGDLLRAVTAAVKSKVETKRPSVNVEFINPFIDSTRNVLQTMCGVEIIRKKLYLKEDHNMLGEISGVMGLTGTASGSVVVSFTKKQACFMVGKMLGQNEFTEITPEVCDGVGEIVNMIAGQAKSMLTKTKYHFQISIPSVVSGMEHEISHQSGTPNIVVLFTVVNTNEDFALQVCLAPNESA